MFDKILLNLAIPFIFRQLEKFQEKIDWAKVEADLDKKVRDLVPGSWFDAEAVSAVNFVLHSVQKALSKEDALKSIIKALVDQKWDAAYAALKSLVLSSVELYASNDDKKKANELFSSLA